MSHTKAPTERKNCVCVWEIMLSQPRPEGEHCVCVCVYVKESKQDGREGEGD